MEAISHAGICVGILAKDGIVLAVEKKITSKLLENISSEKMYKVSSCVRPRAWCCFMLVGAFCAPRTRALQHNHAALTPRHAAVDRLL
jgi:hypothetical protein